MNNKIFGDFYSPVKALSYNRNVIFSTGSRSIGKSTGWMIYCIDHYLKTGQGFLYLRRTDKEINRTAPTACNTAVSILRDFGYPVERVEYKRGFYTLYKTDLEEDKGEVIGRSLGLNLGSNDKSIDYSWIDEIVYDEFMVVDSTKYLGSKDNPLKEYVLCDELYKTVARKKGQAYRDNVKFIFIANVSTYYSPLYVGFGIDRYITPEAKYIAPKTEIWVVEQTASVKAIEGVENSIVGRFGNRALTDYAYHGKALLDGDNTFVEKVTEPMSAYCSVKYQNNVFGVYYIKNRGIIYISKQPTQLKPIALTVADGGVDYTIVQKPGESYPIKKIQDFMKSGKVFFENKRIKMLICTYMQLIPALS